MKKKFTTILLADVVGYGRLMSSAEEETHDRLSKRWRLAGDLVNRYAGNMIKFTGDGFLATFENPVEGVRCAIAVQDEMARQNTHEMTGQQIEFRIGMDVGNVIHDRGDVFGNNVNLAARLEALSKPGGICISEALFHLVGNEINITFTYVGEKLAKNIDSPVQVWRVEMQNPGTEKRDLLRLRPNVVVREFSVSASSEFTADFCDGLRKDIVSELTRFRTLTVANRKQKDDIQSSGGERSNPSREHDFVISGQVSEYEDNLRIRIELTDSVAQKVLWADRYDRLSDNIFKLQDDVTSEIVANVTLEIENALLDEIEQHPMHSWRAFDYCIKGDRLMLSSRDLQSCTQAKNFFERAAKIDGTSAVARLNLSRVEFRLARIHSKGDEARYRKLIDSSYRNARLAVDMDNSNMAAQALLGFRHVVNGNYARGEQLIDRAHNINPNDGRSAMLRVTCLIYLGRVEEAVELARETIARTKKPPEFYYFDLAEALFYNGEYNEASRIFERLSQKQIEEQSCVVIACFGQVGKTDEANRQADIYLDRVSALWASEQKPLPETALAWELEHEFWFKNEAERQRLLDGLGKTKLGAYLNK